MAKKTTIPAGAQLLTLPIDACAVTAGYKNQLYAKQFGFGHFGVDMVSDEQVRTVYAMGDGEVIAAGLDGNAGDYSGLGWVTVIRYNKVYIPGQDRVADLVATTMHHAPGSLMVAKGDRVTRGTVIGEYGNTGGTTVNGGRMGPHLHLQFDTDTKWPLYCFGISGRGSKILTKGTVESTINPYLVLVCHDADGQTIRTRDAGWAEDWSQLPTWTRLMGQAQDGSTQAELDYMARLLEEARQELAAERSARVAAEAKLTSVRAWYSNIPPDMLIVT